MTSGGYRCGITGLGVVSSLGVGIETFRNALLHSVRNFRRLEGIPVPRNKYLYALCDWPQSPDRAAQMALAAASEALANSRCDIGSGRRTGLIVGTVWGDTDSAERGYESLVSGVPPSPELLAALKLYPIGSVADRVGEELSLRGPRFTICSACASTSIAMGIALDTIRRGDCDSVVVVGVEQFSLTGLWGAERSGFVGRELKPFDLKRAGTVLGEGAAAIVLEAAPASHDRALAWLEGYGCLTEPGAAILAFKDDGSGLRASMTLALADSGRRANEIEYVNAHSPGNFIDLAETRAVSSVWAGESRIPDINTTKSITGHLSGAAAVTEAIAVIEQMRGGFLHGNVGYESPDPGIPVAVLGPQTKVRSVERAISNSLASGAINASIVLVAPNVAPTARRLPDEVQVVVTGSSALRAPGRAQGDDDLDWFDVDAWFAPETGISLMNRSGQLGGAAALRALEDARFAMDGVALSPSDVAVVNGAWLGGWPAGSTAMCEGLLQTPIKIFPSTTFNNGCHLGGIIVCRQYGLLGPQHTISGSISSGLQAVATAFDLVRDDRAKAAVILAYDTDHKLLRIAARWLPHCATLTDLVDGAASLVIESEAVARARGATPKARIAGFASISGSLDTSAAVESAADVICSRLERVRAGRLLLCPPRDRGLERLADLIASRLGVQIETGSDTHCGAAEAVRRIAEDAYRQPFLVLSGQSGSSQVCIGLAPV
jgi:3-oxoacyl-[acyl-carrier-protein] synthase II